MLSMAAASEYLLDPIRNGPEFTLYRGRQNGNPSPVLVVAPTAEQPLPQSLRRLEHEYSLAAELEPAWAAKPRPQLRSDSERAVRERTVRPRKRRVHGRLHSNQGTISDGGRGRPLSGRNR